MNATALVEQIKEELELIKHHSDLYFNKAKPEITDAEFDNLIKDTQKLIGELERTDSQNSYINQAINELADVGAEPTYGKIVVHPSTMGSLEKVNELPDLHKFLTTAGKNDVMVVMTPKIDGLAVRICYENGKLTQAATRGDGAKGQDVTDNVKFIEAIPKTIEFKEPLELRGEIYMKRSTFKTCGVEFANPRNAASGVLSQKDPKETGKVALHFFVYDVKAEGKVFPTDGDKEMFVGELEHFEYVPCEFFKLNENNIDKRVAKYENEIRVKLDYDIDGLVFAFNDRDIQEDLGWRGRCPLGKIAFKFKPEQKESDCIGFIWQVGRQGRLTPVAVINPTLISGSTISKLSVHNFRMVKTLKLRIGSKVLIEKAGEIIPQAVRVINPDADYEKQLFMGTNLEKFLNYPTNCPSCKHPTTVDSNGVSVWCNNPLCPEKVETRVLHYLKTLEIKGVGDGSIEAMHKAGILNDLPDLYYLDVKRVQAITGGKRSAEIIVEAILGNNKIPLDLFLAALGIENLGKTTAKELAKKFKTLDAIRKLTRSELCGIGGIGVTTAESIWSGLNEMSATIDKLLECVTVVDVQEINGALKGMSFCFTGAMAHPRKELEKMVEAAGGEAKSAVAKGLTYLVMADASSTSSKAEKARKLGTKCISEEEFLDMAKNS